MAFAKGETHGLNNYLLHCPYLSSLTGDEMYVWNKEDLRPSMFYFHKNRLVDSFFGGLVFEAIRGNDGSVLSGKAQGFGRPPSVGSWKMAYEELFQSGRNLAATVELSTEIPNGKTVDLWIALPYPIVSHQPFGEIGEQDLHFRHDSKDREIALKWWIDQVVTKWKALSNQVSDHRTRFCGFVWPKSSIPPHEEQMLCEVNAYVQELGYKSMWMHHYGALYGHEGKKFGFDLVLTRPTYLGLEQRGLNWVQNAAVYSNAFDQGLILWAGGMDDINKMIEVLNLGCNSFMEAFQLFELPFKTLKRLYESEDPLYVYLYAYTKNAYKTIVLPATTIE